MSKKNEQILFQLENIELVGTELSLPEKFKPLENYNYEISLESRLDSERKGILIKLLIQIASEDIKYASLKSSYWFTVENFEQAIGKDKAGKYTVPADLQTSLSSICISTARGLLFSAFRGTALHNAILPVIDPSQFEAGQQ